MIRKIIKIDEEKCTGCGDCIPECKEGALQIIDGKCRLVSELFCDGLGACIGHCPEGAITIEEREADAYDEVKVIQGLLDKPRSVLKAHLKHLRDHGADDYLDQAIKHLNKLGIESPNEGYRE
jgi:MinD superfamily P-loop ATPase